MPDRAVAAAAPASAVLESWNGEAVDVRAVPVLPVARFRSTVLAALAGGGRLAALFGRTEGGQVLVTAVLADDPEGGSASSRRSSTASTRPSRPTRRPRRRSSASSRRSTGSARRVTPG
jgi:hypothetical protein